MGTVLVEKVGQLVFEDVLMVLANFSLSKTWCTFEMDPLDHFFLECHEITEKFQ